MMIRTSTRWVCAGCLFAAVTAPVAAQCEIENFDSGRPEAGEFAHSIALSSTFMAIGAPFDNSAGSGRGAVYIYAGAPGDQWNWPLVQVLTPSGVDDNENFGTAVATNGDVLVVGAEKGDLTSTNTGRIRIYRRNTDGIWELLHSPTFLGAQGNERHGHAVAMHNTTIAVASDNWSDAQGNANVGRVIVYEPSVGNPEQWVQVQTITVAGLPQTSRFGTSLSLAGDTLVVGAPGDNWTGGTANTASGAAYIYRRSTLNPTQWNFEARVIPQNPSGTSGFAWGVSTDGTNIAIGARRESFAGAPNQTGTVYVYSRSTPTGPWQTSTPVRVGPPTLDGSLAPIDRFSYFGESLFIDQGRLYVAAPRYPGGGAGPDTGPLRGGLFAFRKDSGQSNWLFKGALTKQDPRDGEQLGLTLAASTSFIVGGSPKLVGGRGGATTFALELREGINDDCDLDLVSDLCEIVLGTSADCDGNGKPDNCTEGSLAPIAVWTAPFKGIFTDPLSWCDELPSPLHNIIFRSRSPDGLPNEVVTIATQTVRGLEVRDAEPTLISAAGSRLNVIDPGSAAFQGRTVRVGNTPAPARLDLLDGQLSVGSGIVGSLMLAAVDGASAGMRLEGAGTLLEVAGETVVGERGPATLDMQDGAAANLRTLNIGSSTFDESIGTVSLIDPLNINDAPPTLTVNEVTQVARGALELQSRAEFSSGSLTIQRNGALRTDAPISTTVVNFGRVSRLNTRGPIVINGLYEQVQSGGLAPNIGRLELNLGTGAPGTSDSLQVNGIARLSGGLIINAASNFNPLVNTAFEVVSADTLTADRFSVATFPALPDLKFLRLRYDSNANTVELVVDSLAPRSDTGFEGPQGYNVSAQVTAVALGSIALPRSEEFPDLVVTIAGLDPGDPQGGSVIIFPNTRDPDVNAERFGSPISFPIRGDPVALSVAQFDNLGGDEIVILDRLSQSVQLLRQIDIPGQMTAPALIFSAGMNEPAALLLADVDNSTRIDITVAGRDSSAGVARVSSLVNRGEVGGVWGGMLQSRVTSFATDNGFISFDTGDLDNDKSLPRVPAWTWGMLSDDDGDDDSELVVLRNLRGGTLGSWQGFALSSITPLGFRALAADTGDLDNDKRLPFRTDLLIGGESDDGGVVAVYRAVGDLVPGPSGVTGGVFAAPVLLSFPAAVRSVVAANLDSDSDIDAAVITADAKGTDVIEILRNDFLPPDTTDEPSTIALTVIPGPSAGGVPRLLTAGDVDNAGGEDLIVINDTESPDGLPGSRTVGDEIALVPTPPSCIADLNGDSVLDFFDAIIFLGWFDAQDPRADFTNDGNLDFFDILAFVSALSAGC